MNRPSTADLQIPRQWTEFTPEWVSIALSRRHPGAMVSEVDVVDRDDGFTRRGRLMLTYSAGEGPSAVFVKAPPRLGHRMMYRAGGVAYVETRIHRLEESLPIEMPFAYAAVIDKKRWAELVVLEDVVQRGARPNYAKDPLDVDTVAHGVDELARLHGRYWGFTRTAYPALAWVPRWRARTGITLATAMGTRAALGRDPNPIALDMLPDALRDWRHLTRFHVRAARASATGTPTLLHADAHVGNTYTLPGNRIGFYDWQTTSVGSWEQDFGTFIVSALEIADRRAHERELLERYLARLRETGVDPPTQAEAWSRYRATPSYGLGTWVATLGLGDYQREENCLAKIRRFAAAAIDLDTEAALTPGRDVL